MQNGKVIAAGVALGYLLGRTKKMKLALMLGAAAMGSRLDMKSLASKGTALLEASPGAQRLVSEVRDRVGESGKAAVGAMASKGMDALSDTLERRTERMRGDGARPDDEAEAEAEEPAEPDEAEEEEEEEPEEEPEPPKRRSRSSGGSRGGSGGSRSRSGSTTRKRTAGAAKRSTGSRQRRSRSNG